MVYDFVIDFLYIFLFILVEFIVYYKVMLIVDEFLSVKEVKFGLSWFVFFIFC